MTEDTPTADDQPAPLTPAQNYRRAMQRLKALHERRVIATGSVDVVKLESNAAMRAVELNAIANLLVEHKLFTLEQLHEAIAVSAVNAGNKLFAEMNAPKVIGADGQKLNGS